MRGVVARVFAGVCAPDRPSPTRAFPSYADDAPIRERDVFCIDMSGSVDGHVYDFSRSRVGGSDVHGAAEALALAQRVVESTVDALPPGTSVAEAAAAGYAVMEDAGDTLRDGWFDRGAFEHSVVITDGAPEILSVAPHRFSGR
ncbi:MAG: peptidase [Solirubrobacterales bacterium]|nr:peptidase [Solirubrobacterales bacterium]